MTISVLLAFKSMPGEVREMEFDDEEHFWRDFRASQKVVEKESGGTEVIFALLPKLPTPSKIPDEL